ncbi:hypothetical protein R2A130_3079 [Ahrensia sp. R2A130]|nr:hypothetical protein R2A130_3079 [Ahrensia sp. R2A130]
MQLFFKSHEIAKLTKGRHGGLGYLTVLVCIIVLPASPQGKRAKSELRRVSAQRFGLA